MKKIAVGLELVKVPVRLVLCSDGALLPSLTLRESGSSKQAHDDGGKEDLSHRLNERDMLGIMPSE